jgi:hypothetical protein
VTRGQAQSKALTLWYRQANDGCETVGDRSGSTCIRRKTVADRFEVGFIELSSTRWTSTVLGRGPSWEAAFEMATGDQTTSPSCMSTLTREEGDA